MTIEELSHFKNFLVLGYGIEGKATQEFLQHHFPEKEIGIADEKFDEHYLDMQDEYELVIKTPGIPKQLVKKPYTTATNIFFANTRQNIIGITGTGGKSTLAYLTYTVLKHAGKDAYLAGNIGRPMLDVLLKEDITDESIFVLELSSYQLDDMRYSPHIACIINIYKDLHNHESFEDYVEAKKNIIARSTYDDYFVYDDSQLLLREISQQTKAKKMPFISSPFSDSRFYTQTLDAAWTITSLFDIDQRTFEKSMKGASQLPHRLENLGKHQGIIFVDDAASKHPQATIKALQSINDINTLILGGQDRGYDFADVVRIALEKDVAHFILFPNTEEKIEDSLRSTQKKVDIFKTRSMESAVTYAYKKTEKGKVCLLSPGAPSYTTFSNFNERGDEFRKYIQMYEKKKART